MKKQRAWLYCAMWMGFIFIISATPGDVSSEESGFIVSLLTGIVAMFSGGHAAALDLSLLELLVRKGAHMTEYAVLFLLYRRALNLSGAHRPGIIALLLCIAYAATDEFHQLFVDGRGGSPVDVLIDTAGAALACSFRAAFSKE